ncbi:hypothetical protein DLAC_08968 [Tieghemostelium lacteum]|uniref:MACPF domain-containing protein n=1 Tax=Tieghemostelium lacteum TaxID=361077 RepID=A0A151Z8Q1_TIELA|nr:hypothetical protein DLAC_08968 [Tieghemostelium lacteum]|eukprot:KYQ90353.1 hypothetical protein DLAC_08968 [Tieghemostelium lacteum]
MKHPLLLFILISIIISCVFSQNTVYVDSFSNCIKSCGKKEQPFSNIKDAIDYLDQVTPPSPNSFNDDDWIVNRLILAPGYYSGSLNTGISIKIPIEIVSLEKSVIINQTEFQMDKNQPVIDCLGVSQGFFIDMVKKVKFVNIGIHNCVASNGGAIQSRYSNVEIVNCLFWRNRAENGAAIYSVNSDIVVINTQFIENSVGNYGSVLYTQYSTITFVGNNKVPCHSDVLSPFSNSLYSIGSLVSIETISLMSVHMQCTEGSQLIVGDSLVPCYDTFSCPNLLPKKSIDYNVFNVAPQSTCNNDFLTCGPSENCFSCETDCSCSFDGWRMDVSYNVTTINTNSLYTSNSAANAENMLLGLKDRMGMNKYVKFTSYFNVPKDGKYKFKFVGKSMGLSVYVNMIQYIRFPFTLQFESTKIISVASHHVNRIQLDVLSDVDVSQMDLSIYWKLDGSDDEYTLFQPFYNRNICGDKILDPQEDYYASPFYCTSDSNTFTTSGQCGDGICNELPTDCFADCHMLLIEHCPEQAPKYPLDEIYSKEDFLGSTLDNQYLFSLPGIQLLAHGVDIVSDKFLNSPIFHFGYCDNSSFSTVHDLYRSYVYTVPPGIHAIPVPKCSYETQSNFYSTSSHMASEMSRDTGLSIGAQLSGSYWGISAGASVAFSEEESVKAARDLEQSKSGSIVTTKVECQSTKVQLDGNRIPFHKNFLKDLAEANTVELMQAVVKKYGNVYVESADMGGRLTSVTVVSHSSSESSSSIDTSKHTKLDFAVQVSSPILNVNGDIGLSVDNKISAEQQQQFSQESQSSTIISYGGPTGAYGPDTLGSNNFGLWARAVDLLPVPIRKQYNFIVNLIPPNWMAKGSSPNQQSIVNLWTKAEYANMYKTLVGESSNIASDETIYIISSKTQFSNQPLTISGWLWDSQGNLMQFEKVLTVTSNTPFVTKLMNIMTSSITTFDHEIIDLVNSRSFIFGSQASLDAKNRYTIRLSAPEAIMCRLGDCTSMPSLYYTLRGRLGTLEVMGNPITTTNDITYSFFGKYIGELESISVSMKVTFTDDVTKINEFIFTSFTVTQSCPNSINDWGANTAEKCQIPSKQAITGVYTKIYSNINKLPEILTYNKPITKSLSTKRLTPLVPM